MLAFLNVILGGILLFVGRKLFWLLVGVIGFAIGIQIAARFFKGSEVTHIIAGLVLGAIFAGLAVFLESLAIGIAGFLGGGYILLSLAGLFNLDKGLLGLILFVVGGVIGSILIASLLNWALIIISSLAGASMIVRAVDLRYLLAGLLFLILLAAGIAVQASALHREHHPEPRHND